MAPNGDFLPPWRPISCEQSAEPAQPYDRCGVLSQMLAIHLNPFFNGGWLGGSVESTAAKLD